MYNRFLRQLKPVFSVVVRAVLVYSFPMQLRQFAILFFYILDVCLCLLAIRKKNSRVYALTKPFLTPLLCAVYFLFLPVPLRGLHYQKFVIVALALHCLGDVFLLFPRGKSRHMFYLGMLSFFSGHVFYTLWFVKADVGHSNNGVILALLLCFLVEYGLFRQLILGPRKYAPILLPYSFGLCAIAVAIASTAGNGSPFYATLISFAGVALFYFSDFCIMRRMVRLPLFGQMTVMSTYIAGQSLIVLGMLLMQV